MNTDTILRLLQNSGFHNIRVDTDFIYVEDPSCILRSFETFTEYAWFAIVIITGIMLTGWAISMIRGARNDIFTNLRNLLIIFGALAAAKPIVNFVYGDDLFARGCRTISAPMDEVMALLDARNERLGISEANLYEFMDVYDSGIVNSVPGGGDVPVLDTSPSLNAAQIS